MAFDNLSNTPNHSMRPNVTVIQQLGSRDEQIAVAQLSPPMTTYGAIAPTSFVGGQMNVQGSLYFMCGHSKCDGLDVCGS